jgi:hypothetical protein
MAPVAPHPQPYVTPIASQLAKSKSNVWGQSSPTMEMLDKQIAHYTVQTAAKLREVAKLEQHLTILREERDKLLEAERALREVDEMIQKRMARDAEINALKKKKAAVTPHTKSSSSSSTELSDSDGSLATDSHPESNKLRTAEKWQIPMTMGTRERTWGIIANDANESRSITDRQERRVRSRKSIQR